MGSAFDRHPPDNEIVDLVQFISAQPEFAVGFGIKTPDDVRAISACADGAVVGSAVCSAIEQAADADSAVKAVSQLVAALRSATVRSGLK
jgi:tryptophan synthase alpha chain